MAALAVFSLLAAAIVVCLSLAVQGAELFADYGKAAERAAAVEALLRLPAAYCGFGMPLEADRYREAFGGLPMPPYDWPGPISVADTGVNVTNSSDRRRDGILNMVYAVPCVPRTRELVLLGGESRLITLDSAPDARELAAPFGKGPFACFGSAIPPGSVLEVTGISRSGGLTVGGPLRHSVSVQKYDRLHIFRAVKMFAFRDILYTDDFLGAGRQPRLNGVRDLRFRADAEKQKITVYVLTRGDKKYRRTQRIRRLEQWPGEYLEKVEDLDVNYMLFVTKFVLELPNCTALTVLNDLDAAEVF